MNGRDGIGESASVQADHSYARQELEVEAEVLVQTQSTSNSPSPRAKPKANPDVPSNGNSDSWSWKEGRRVVELGFLVENMFCNECHLPLPIQNIVGEHCYGLG